MLIPPTRACFPCVCVFSPVSEPRRAPCEQRKKRRNYTGLSLALMSAPLVQNTTGTRGKQQPSARIPVSKPVSFPEKTRKTHRLWPAASSPPGKASQRNNQCRGRVGVPGKYCNSPTHPCSKKKKKKKKSVKKSRIQTIETHFFVLLLTLDRLKKQILENKNPQKQNKNVKKKPKSGADERTWTLWWKKEKQKAERERRVDNLISVSAIPSPLRSLCHASLLSPGLGGARSISALPDCQSVSVQAARLPGLLLQQQTGPRCNSKRPVREGRGAEEEPPVSQFHAWPYKVNRVDDVTGVQLRRRGERVRGAERSGDSESLLAGAGCHSGCRWKWGVSYF